MSKFSATARWPWLVLVTAPVRFTATAATRPHGVAADERNVEVGLFLSAASDRVGDRRRWRQRPGNWCAGDLFGLVTLPVVPSRPSPGRST
jgi:hypothetical protein